MKVSHKINLAFVFGGLLLLAVEVAGYMVITRLSEMLRDTNRSTRQSDQVAGAVRALRSNPTTTAAHLARLDDLARGARSDDEIAWVATAREVVATGQPVALALDPLEHLSAFYIRESDLAGQELLKIHDRITLGLVVVMVDSILLFGVLVWMVHAWLVRPARLLATKAAAMPTADPLGRIPQVGDDEFTGIATALNKLNTEVTRLNDQMAQDRRLAVVGEACTHVTHNVRSLLGSIRSLAQHESTAATDLNARVGFNYIIALVQKLDGWVRDIHAQVAAVNPRIATQDLEPVVHDAISFLEPKLTEKAIQLNLQTDETLTRVSLDRSLFEQAFLAVATNAIEASPDSGTVSIHLSGSKPGFVSVIITDQGPGMGDQTRQHAFDPFFTTKASSAGLGLTVANNAVRKHGGEIEIESEEKKGTRVALHFPVAKPPA